MQFRQFREDPLDIGWLATNLALVLDQETEEVIGGHEGFAGGEIGESSLDVGRWTRFGDGELPVEAAEDRVVVCSGHCETDEEVCLLQ